MDLAVALEQLKRIEHGGSAALLVRGEAGIGKTRLAAEIARPCREGRPPDGARPRRRLRPRHPVRGRARRAAVAVCAGRGAGPLRTRVDALREGLDAAAPAGGAPPDAHLSLVFSRAVEVFRALGRRGARRAARRGRPPRRRRLAGPAGAARAAGRAADAARRDDAPDRPPARPATSSGCSSAWRSTATARCSTSSRSTGTRCRRSPARRSARCRTGASSTRRSRERRQPVLRARGDARAAGGRCASRAAARTCSPSPSRTRPTRRCSTACSAARRRRWRWPRSSARSGASRCGTCRSRRGSSGRRGRVGDDVRPARARPRARPRRRGRLRVRPRHRARRGLRGDRPGRAARDCTARSRASWPASGARARRSTSPSWRRTSPSRPTPATSGRSRCCSRRAGR